MVIYLNLYHFHLSEKLSIIVIKMYYTCFCWLLLVGEVTKAGLCGPGELIIPLELTIVLAR